MINIVGYLAMICLMISAIPQLIKVIKAGHADGMSSSYLLLLIMGFSLMATYIMLTKPLYPVVINYVINILSMLTIGYYKIFPRKV